MNAIGYIRVSTSTQDLARQQHLLSEYCELKGHQLVRIISEKQSGADGDREGYIELIRTTKDEADFVVMTEISRLSREDDTVEALHNINILLKKGISVVFLDNNVSNERILAGGQHLSLYDIITIAVQLKEAASERKKTVGRMLTGRRDKFINFSNMCIGRVPFGYEKVNNPDYVINKTPKSFLVRNKNAEYVYSIFSWIIEGMTLKAIALRLQQMNIKTNQGNDFSDSTVATLVHNPIYKGVWTFSNKTIDGDAIVSSEVWEQAQEALKTNKLKTIIRNVNFNPLKGIMKCPCGKSMYMHKNYKYLLFRCAAKKNKYDETICNNGGCEATCVIEACWRAIQRAKSNKDYLLLNNAQIKKIEGEIKEIDRQIEENNTKIEQLKKQMSTLAFRMGIIENVSLLKIWEQQFSELDKEVKSRESSDLPTRKAAKQKMIQTLLSEKTKFATEEEKAQIFQSTLKTVVYYSERVHRGVLQISFINSLKMNYLIVSGKIYDTNFDFDPVTRKFSTLVLDSYVFKTKEMTFDEVLEEIKIPEQE